MEQESRYLTLLGEAAVFDRSPQALTLRDANESILLTFITEQPKSLTGVWQMISYMEADGTTVPALNATNVTAVFGTDGQVTGSAGCNNYFGTYSTEGETISVGPLGLTMMYCESPEGVMDQESGYLAALENVSSYQISGNNLILHTEDGKASVWFMQMP